ncbi:MAG TPA: hypothetical protein EYP39_09870 [Ghiorsea sp.]|nr:hypothetical protein [Ghiorsea sp.]
MKKNYIFKTMLALFILVLGGSFSQVKAQNYFYIGTATTTSSSSDVPFYTYYHDKRSSYIILASELQAAGASGSILSLALDVATPAAQAMNGFNVKIGHTTAGTIAGFMTGLTTVYSAASHTATSGWNNFAFTTPFAWDGVSNVVVEICFDNSSYTSSSTMYYTTTSFNSSYGQYADSWAGPGCTMTTGSTPWGGATKRPNTRLEFSPPFPNDAAITALNNPTFPTCVMDSVVKVELKNFGTANLTSATVNWDVNGTVQASVAWTGNLAPFAGDTVTLGTYAGGFTDGDVLTVYSSMPNAIPDSNNVNDTLQTVLFTSLSGTYVIDAAGTGDFISFADAILAMENFGICAATVFEVVDGTYVEQIDLVTYIGMSSVNTVTFRSQSGNASGVMLSYSAASTADNFVVNFNCPALNLVAKASSQRIDKKLSDSFDSKSVNIIY